MRAISILEPWASAIAFHGKDIENRTWPAPAKVVGQIVAIHASAGLHELRGFRDLRHAPAHQRPLVELAHAGNCDATRCHYVATGIVAETLTEADFTALRWRSPWFCGPQGQRLAQVVPVTPSTRKMLGPVRGKLGYWTVGDDDALALLADREHQLQGASMRVSGFCPVCDALRFARLGEPGICGACSTMLLPSR